MLRFPDELVFVLLSRCDADSSWEKQVCCRKVGTLETKDAAGSKSKSYANCS